MTMSLQKYSVLMSVYKKTTPSELVRSIESMLQQTVKPAEIVIVEDGPITNEVSRVLSEYEAAYPGLFKIGGYTEGKGLWYALRYGMNACTFELIARMDSDDYAHPDRIERELRAFADDPSLGCVGTNVVEFEGDPDNPVALVELPSVHEEIIRFGRRRCPYRHSTLLYRKSAVVDAGGYQEMPLFEDYDLFLRMARSGVKFRNINEPLMYMATDNDFFMRRGQPDYLRKMLRFRRECLRRGDIRIWDYIVVSVPHIITILAPNRVRRFIYQSFLRKPARKSNQF